MGEDAFCCLFSGLRRLLCCTRVGQRRSEETPAQSTPTDEVTVTAAPTTTINCNNNCGIKILLQNCVCCGGGGNIVNNNGPLSMSSTDAKSGWKATLQNTVLSGPPRIPKANFSFEKLFLSGDGKLNCESTNLHFHPSQRANRTLGGGVCGLSREGLASLDIPPSLSSLLQH